MDWGLKGEQGSEGQGRGGEEGVGVWGYEHRGTERMGKNNPKSKIKITP
jgi:hypothetical protein